MPDDDLILTLPSRRHRHPNPIYTFIIHPESVFIHFFYAFSMLFRQSSGSPGPRPKAVLVVSRMWRLSEGLGTTVT